MHDPTDPALGIRSDGKDIPVVSQCEIAIGKMVGDVGVAEKALQSFLEISGQTHSGAPRISQQGRGAYQQLSASVSKHPDS